MKQKILIVLLSFILSNILSAEQWQIVGTRAMGMGGAYVAMARGPIAQYWNPAGLIQLSHQNFSGIEINAGVGIEATGGILNHVSEITDLSDQIKSVQNSQTTNTNIDANQFSAFVKTLGILNEITKKDEVGVLAEVNGSFGIKISKLALSLNNYTSVGANPFIDVNNINIVNSNPGNNLPTDTDLTTYLNYQDEANQLANLITTLAGNSNLSNTNLSTLLCGNNSCLPSSIDTAQELANALVKALATQGVSEQDIQNFINQASQYVQQASELIANIGGSFDNNQSSLNLKARSFTELAIGYAWNLNKYLTGLNFGVNIKAVKADIAQKTFKFVGESETGDAFKDILDNRKTSTKPAIDLGFLWYINDKYPKIPFKPKAGLTIRNLNGPKFDDFNGTYKLEPQARFGLAFSPFNWWHFAFDMDITKNSTPVDGFKSRQIAFGTEINILNRKSFNLPLRLGLLKNIAEKDSKTMYTAGFGLTFAYIHINAAVGVSSGKSKIDDKKYPQKAQGVVNIGILF
ncbi:MAG: conjugal transfer protein TraF [Elusimicrobiales bacterium]|nr:conjugal transfer protein TraF [Elusimicrobiales bacterium]